MTFIYIYSFGAVVIAYFVGSNSNKKGFGFWRSFIFILLLFAIILAFLSKQLGMMF